MMGRVHIVAATLTLSLAALGCYGPPTYEWHAAGKPEVVAGRAIDRRTVSSREDYRLLKNRAAVERGNTITVPCVRAVEEIEETTREKLRIREMKEIEVRRANWWARNFRWLTLGAGLGMMGKGAADSFGADSPPDSGSGWLFSGTILVGSGGAFDIGRAKREPTGKTKEEEEVIGKEKVESPPRTREYAARGVRFSASVAPPFSLLSSSRSARYGELVTDAAGHLKVPLKLPEGVHLDAGRALEKLKVLPEAMEVSTGLLTSRSFQAFLRRGGLDEGASKILLRPLGVRRIDQGLIELPVTFWSLNRSAFHRAAADICDREINAKLRRIAVSVRDARTFKPVRATVGLTVKAPSPEEVLGKHLSGGLLKQALERAGDYARGESNLEVTGGHAFVTLMVPVETIAYKVAAPGYAELTGRIEQVQSGPLVLVLEREEKQ